MKTITNRESASQLIKTIFIKINIVKKLHENGCNHELLWYYEFRNIKQGGT